MIPSRMRNTERLPGAAITSFDCGSAMRDDTPCPTMKRSSIILVLGVVDKESGRKEKKKNGQTDDIYIERER